MFVVIDCGYVPRSALEIVDGSENRLQKIERLIEESKFGIHDLSNMEIDLNTNLPRFNMSLELGLFLGAKRFGDSTQSGKRCLVLDKERFRYRDAISDISGQDVDAHGNDPRVAIRCVRNWLQTVTRRKTLPGGREIHERYCRFEESLPDICAKNMLDKDELTFNDLWETINEWQVDQFV